MAAVGRFKNGTEDSIFARRPIATGVAVGVVSLAPHLFLSPEMSLAFAAILLGVVAGVYLASR